MDEAQSSQESLQWFAMRDLKRRHAKLPAYKLFESLKVQYFTPMVHRLVVVNGKGWIRKCLSCRICFL